VKHHEQPTVAGAAIGLGALAGHVEGGMSRGDLKELGELLDIGDIGLLIVAAQDTEARIDEAVKHGNKIVKKQLRSDQKDLEAALDEAIKESKS
jgi:Protein of unknown function (DUF1269)